MVSPAISPRVWRQLLRLPPCARRSIYTAANPEIYDIVCVGGGPAGLALLSALRSQPSTQQLKVALIDSQDLTSARPESGPDLYSNRCSSLTPSSVRFLEEIGVWRHVSERRTQPYHGIEVWDGVSGSRIGFDPSEVGGGGILDSLAELVPGSRFAEIRRRYDADQRQSVVATMCENDILTKALLRQLSETKRVDIFDKTKADSIELGSEGESINDRDLSLWPVISMPSGRKLAARLLVGADGANSPVRNFADITSEGWDYNQHGVVATLTLDRHMSIEDYRIAFQRFLPYGPVALLPMPDDKASLVWSISTPLANKLKQLSPENFVAMVNAAFRLEPVDINYFLTTSSAEDNLADEVQWRLRNVLSSKTGTPNSMPTVTAVQDKSIASFPLRMRHASTYTGHRIALIGDAAHTIHPLAGQGLNLGLGDAESLALRISYGVEHGMDIGTCWCLDNYNADRWAKNNAVMGVCDKLQKLYSFESGHVVWGRSLGLDIVDRLGPVKRMLMGAAGGVR